MYSAAAGMEVTVSKTDITYNGWTGCGYIVINPVTGSGGYMISGGASGAWLPLKSWLKFGFGVLLLSIAGALAFTTITVAMAEGMFIAIVGILLTISFFLQALMVLYGPEKTGELFDCLLKSFVGIVDVITEVTEKGIDYILTIKGAKEATKKTFKTAFKLLDIPDTLDDINKCFSDLFDYKASIRYLPLLRAGEVNGT
jgi:hypothetical protein